MLKALVFGLIVTGLHAETTAKSADETRSKPANARAPSSSAMASSGTNADVDTTLKQIEAALARQTDSED